MSYITDGPLDPKEYLVEFFYPTEVAWKDVEGCPALNEFMQEHANDVWNRDDYEETTDPDELEVSFDRKMIPYLKENLPVQALNELYKLYEAENIEVEDVDDLLVWFEDHFDNYEVVEWDSYDEWCC